MKADILKRLEELFEMKISQKTGWGKNEIMKVFRKAVTEVLLEIVEGKLE